MKTVYFSLVIIFLFSCKKENEIPKTALKKSEPFTCDGESYYVKMSDENIIQQNQLFTFSGNTSLTISTFQYYAYSKIDLKTLKKISEKDISINPVACTLNKDFKWWVLHQIDVESKVFRVSLMDTSGNISLSTKNIECPSHDIRIAPTNDNGFIIGMLVNKEVSENSYIHTGELKVLLYDKNAQLIWDKTYTGIYGSWGFNLLEVTGGFLITSQEQKQQYLYKALLTKIDEYGDLIWQKKVSSQEIPYTSSYICDIMELTSKDYIIYMNGNNFENIILKTDSSGNLIWKTESKYDRAVLISLPDNSIVVSYTKKNPENQNTLNVVVSGISSDGKVEWEEEYGGTGDETPIAIYHIPSVGYSIICESKMFTGEGHFYQTSSYAAQWEDEYKTYDYIIKTDLQGKSCR